MSAKYFRSELAYLRDMGRAFAKAHPNTASLLSDRSADPDVERLLEGVAFLSSRVRARIDDAVPELAHGLAEVVLPHALRTVPATSIVSFQADPRNTRGLRVLPAGTKVESIPVDGQTCTFRTTTELAFAPLWVESLKLDSRHATRPRLIAELKGPENPDPGLKELRQLRFYLHDDPWTAASLLEWLHGHLDAVQLVNAAGQQFRLPTDRVRMVGLEEDEGTLPWPARAPTPYRLLTEYFVLPHKFQFIELSLPESIDLSTFGERFELSFDFERPPPLPGPLGRSALRLHCTPVVNAFEAVAEPIRIDPLVERYPLRALGLDTHHFEVLGVQSAKLLIAGRSEGLEVRDYHELGIGSGPDAPPAYALHRSRSILDEGTQTELMMAGDIQALLGKERASLSAVLLGSNRDLTSQLKIGDISRAPRGAALPEFSNIAPVSSPIRPPLGEELQWRLLSFLALGHKRAADPDSLRNLLSLHNFPGQEDSPAKRANEIKIDSIRECHRRTVTRLIEGAPVRGHQSRLTLDESRFTGTGEAFLLGCVIDRLLAAHTTLNSFHELEIELHPSGRTQRWLTKNGGRPIY